MKPNEDRIFIEPDAPEAQTAAGIIIPDTAQERPLIGTIVAVGKGKPSIPMHLKVGMRVMYPKFTGIEQEYNGRTILVMKQADVYSYDEVRESNVSAVADVIPGAPFDESFTAKD